MEKKMLVKEHCENGGIMKKCLILGDYSSLGKNLKRGLERNKIETTVISNGDGWKSIVYDDSKDIVLNLRKNIRILGKEVKGSARILYLLTYILKLKNKLKKNKFDFILIMNQSFVSNSIVPNKYNSYYLSLNFLKKILNENGKIFMLACGDDSYYLQSEKIYRYFPYTKEDTMKSNYMYKNSLKKYMKILEQIDGVIPTCWDYAEAYRKFYKNNKKIKETIQFPLDLSEIEYKPNVIKDKIVIFHGLNREDFKGTKYIKEAMENIKKKYTDKVEIIVDGKMSLKEYKKILEKSNIVIDQCKFYSYGMNALIAMAQGKVVFSGNEKECMEELKREDIPIINITPSVKDIEEKLEYFINNSYLITEIGDKSRKFVEEFHECKIVAKKYLDFFNM